MQSTIAWRVLSADTVMVDGALVDLTKRSRSVLVLLLLNANRVVSIDQIADALWGEEQPKTARNSISRFVLDLRRALGPYDNRIESISGGYRVVVGDDEFDLDVVEAALSTSSPNLERGVNVLNDAVKLAGSRPNPVTADLFGYEAVDRAHAELRIAVHEALAKVLFELGDHAQLIVLLERAVDQHPYHEAFWLLLMQALDRAGRSVEALNAGQRLRSLLDDMGVIPADQVQEIEADILNRLSEPASLVAPPARPREAGTPHEIADPGTTLVGRVDELRAVHRLIDEHRLVSIIGLGGTGKTRVALGAVAAFDTGTTPIYEVGLRPISDPALVVPTIASVLGVPAGQATNADALAQAVSQHSFVLVIDNCEHLKDTCCDVVAALLSHAPGVRILTTSREALDVEGETTYFLAPLSLDEDGPFASAAVELLLDRAGPMLEDVSIESRQVLSEICRRLNGLPLAIEIAAAQLAYMTPAQLRDRVAAPVDGARSAGEPAVSAVTEMLDWAWSVLSPSQQALLARLSIFDSGWTIKSAEAVRAGPGSIEADLRRLVTSSLVTTARHGETERFEVLAPVREFSAQRLDERGEAAIMRDRLVTWAQAITSATTFPQQHLWSHTAAALVPEHGNLIAALTHLEAQGRTEELVQLAVDTSGMMVNSGFAEDLVRWIVPYLDDTALPKALRGAACVAVSTARHATGDLEHIALVGEKAVELAAGEPYDWVPVLAGYFSVWSLIAPTTTSTAELQAIARKAAENSPTRRTNLAVAALYEGHVSFVSRNYEQALASFREAKELVDHPGRGLLVIEIGETLCHYMLERHDEALATVHAWVSRPDTDHWHYILDVVRAIIVGGTGAADKATADLAHVVRSLPAAKAWGRAGIVQTGFAMLADFRGEHDLASDLFASAINRDIMLLAVAIGHVMKTRGLSGDEAWLEVGIEFWTRIVPDGSAAATLSSTPQLLQWWTTGELGAASRS